MTFKRSSLGGLGYPNPPTRLSPAIKSQSIAQNRRWSRSIGPQNAIAERALAPRGVRRGPWLSFGGRKGLGPLVRLPIDTSEGKENARDDAGVFNLSQALNVLEVHSHRPASRCGAARVRGYRLDGRDFR